MNNIFLKRKKQLELQELIDDNLKKYADKCPKKIISLILEERELNRKQVDGIREINPIVVYDNLKKNLEELDVLYEKMRNFNC